MQHDLSVLLFAGVQFHRICNVPRIVKGVVIRPTSHCVANSGREPQVVKHAHALALPVAQTLSTAQK